MRLSSLLPISLSLLSTALASQVPFSAPSSSFRPTHVSQSIELGGSLTRSTTLYVLAHEGAGTNWVVGVKGQEGFVEAFEAKGNSKSELVVTKLGRNDDDITFYTLEPSLAAGSSTAYISLTSVVSHATSPLPKSLAQVAEAVSMNWNGDLLDAIAGLSAEERAGVEGIKVKVKAPTPRILDALEPEGFDLAWTPGSATIVYTAIGSVGTLSSPQLATVHYQQPEAVTSIRTLDRLIEVSHWGSNLAIMDSMDLYNSGPLLKGYFSRIDHQKATMNRRGSAMAITSLGLTLPPNINSPYFYDIVGNVSTSRFRPSSPARNLGLPSARRASEFSSLELKPRYPLMGGWNYTFTVGYNAPLQTYLKTRGSGNFVLAVPFLTAIKDVAIDDVTLNVRLPEGAKNIKVTTPFPVDSLAFPTTLPSFLAHREEGYTKTYLDTTGRPTVSIRKYNCNDRHGGDLLIEYELSIMTDALQKPLAIGTVFFSFFLFAMFVRRLEWGIGK